MLVNYCKKANYDAKILDINLATADYYKLTNETLDAKKKKELVNKSDSNLVKNSDSDKKSGNISNKNRIKSRAR